MSELSKDVKQQDVFIPRVTQLDSADFDGSIRSILSNQLNEVTKYLRPALLHRILPEIELLVDLLILRNSILKNNATFGQQLLDLKYSEQIAGKSAWGYFLLQVGFPYLLRRYEHSAAGSTTKLRGFVDGTVVATKVLRLANLLVFLRQGIYPTLTDRLLGLRHTSVKRLNRNVGYDYIARELLWHGLMELLMFGLPLVNFQAVKRRLRSMLSRPTTLTQVPSPVLDTRTVCSSCKLRPTTPCRISIYCPHVACYLCLMGNILADEKFCCPDCNAPSTAKENLQYIS